MSLRVSLKRGNGVEGTEIYPVFSCGAVKLVRSAVESDLLRLTKMREVTSDHALRQWLVAVSLLQKVRAKCTGSSHGNFSK